MANNNQLELVVTVEVDKANQSIKSVNANLSGIEAAATKSARAASGGIDGMTASMVKGATAGNLLADAIKNAIEFAKGVDHRGGEALTLSMPHSRRIGKQIFRRGVA